MNIKYQVLLSILLFSVCGGFSVSAQDISTSKISKVRSKSDIILITDHKSFKVTFKDGQFYSWLTKQSPKKKYLQSSLEIKNLQYATEWNRRVDNPKYNSDLYTQLIDYQIKPKKHYGIDVNYELYMYFKFFEEKHEKLLINS